jgi:hypothetical protein
MRNILFLLSLGLIIPTLTQAQNIPVKVIYFPDIPKPESLNKDKIRIKLLINAKGKPERISYEDDILENQKSEINKFVRIAKFTPYLKDGQPVESIVPYTIKFLSLEPSTQDYEEH